MVSMVVWFLMKRVALSISGLLAACAAASSMAGGGEGERLTSSSLGDCEFAVSDMVK